jgi:hypothetical protein
MTIAHAASLHTTMDANVPADYALRGVDATVTASEFAWHEALYAVRTGDREAAQQIITDMSVDDRAAFASHLEELRKLLGPTCAECGALTELGTCTTDTSNVECRFLCSRCTAARRTS